MGNHRTTGISLRSLRSLALGALVALLAVVASVTVADSAAHAAPPSASAAAIPVVGFRLEATLRPVGTAHGSGEFSAVLVETGPPMLKAPGVELPLSATQLPAGCRLSSARNGSMPPDRIKCGTEPAFPIPRGGLHWVLVWRLTHTGLSGTAHAGVETIAGEGTTALLNLCSDCLRTALGHVTLEPALANALLGGDAYAVVSSAQVELRGRIVKLSRSTPTLLSFGRTGGSIRPFKASVGGDGLLQVSGSTWAGRTGKIVPLSVRMGLLKLAQAEAFFTMPAFTRCAGAFADTAARFVTISTEGEMRTVTVHGDCNQPFDEIYAVFQAAILGPPPAG